MKPEMNINTQEVCPSCNGTGKISSSLLLEDEIEKNLTYLVTHQHKQFEVDRKSHHVCISYQRMALVYQNGLWKKKLGQKTRIEADTNYHLTEYKFFDPHDEEIKL